MNPPMESGMIIGGLVLFGTQLVLVAIAILWYRKAQRDRTTPSSR